jgi:hypothetical protein
MFGKQRQEWFQKHLKLENGVPDALTYRRVLVMITPEKCIIPCFIVFVDISQVYFVRGKTNYAQSAQNYLCYRSLSAQIFVIQLFIRIRFSNVKSTAFTFISPEMSAS